MMSGQSSRHAREVGLVGSGPTRTIFFAAVPPPGAVAYLAFSRLASRFAALQGSQIDGPTHSHRLLSVSEDKFRCYLHLFPNFCEVIRFSWQRKKTLLFRCIFNLGDRFSTTHTPALHTCASIISTFRNRYILHSSSSWSFASASHQHS